MTLEEYIAFVRSTNTTEEGVRGGLDYATQKLASEAGEVASLRANEHLRGDPPHGLEGGLSLGRRSQYALEIGDAAWFVFEIADLLGIDIAVVLDINRAKLERRRALRAQGHPTGKVPHAEHELAESMLALAELSAVKIKVDNRVAPAKCPRNPRGFPCEMTSGRCSVCGYEDQADPPGSGSPHFCDHANEVPTGLACVCPSWCYCQTRTCAVRARVRYDKPSAVDDLARAVVWNPTRPAVEVAVDDGFGKCVKCNQWTRHRYERDDFAVYEWLCRAPACRAHTR